MNSLKYLFFGLSVFSLAVLGSCAHEEPQGETTDSEYDDSYYASLASVISNDSQFAATDEGGTIRFKTEGGEVTLSVDCGTGWTIDNSASDLFLAVKNGNNLTVSADQNTVEEELTGTVTFYTAAQHVRFATVSITQNAYDAPEISVGTNEWHAPAVGELSVDITVEASNDWSVENPADWLTVQTIDNGLTIIAAQNTDVEERDAQLILTCTDGIRSQNEYITVSQDGAAYISLSQDQLSFPADGESASVIVESNYDVQCSSVSATWLSADFDGETLVVSVSDNPTDDSREGAVTLTSGDGAENVVEVQLTIIQYGASAMILVYTITPGDTEVRLPISEKVDCTVDWGDGTAVESVKTDRPTHTYSKTGEYNVIINGTVSELISRDITSGEPTTTLTAVKQWGKTGLTEMEYAFYHCTNLKSIPSDTQGSFTDVTEFHMAFENCSMLSSIPEGLFDNCSQATDFYGVFAYDECITSVPEGLFDNCVKSTTFADIFYGCTGLKTVPEGLFANCPEATSFYAAFYGSGITSVPDGLFKGSAKAKSFENTFYGCTSLSSFGSEVFAGCSSATTFKNCFRECTSLRTFPSDIFSGCSAAENFNMMFFNGNVTEIPAGLFDDCVNAKDFSDTFYNNVNLKKIPDGLFDNCPNVTSFQGTFFNCSSLETVPDGLFAKCPLNTSCYITFYNCSSLKAIPKDLFEGNTNVESFMNAFYGCSSLTAIPDGLFDSCAKATNFYGVFYNCYRIAAIPKGLFDNNTAVTTFYFAFYGCSSVAEIPAGLFDNCTQVTTMRSAFCGCSTIKSIPVGLFDNCPEIKSFYGTFNSCTSLTDIPDGLFKNCTKVTDAAVLFQSSTSLKTIPEGLFDTFTEVTDFHNVFSLCSSIETIPTGLFDNCKKVTNFNYAFYDCSSWKGESPYTEIDGVKVHLYDRSKYSDFTVPTSTAYCFSLCTGLSDYNDIPTSWGKGMTSSSLSNSGVEYDVIPNLPEEDIVKPAIDTM